MKRGVLKISLKSNLCAGSGYSYAGVVDSDICYDEWGIPFIPAKRLKGCLRETAEKILYEQYEQDVENFFGSAGNREPGEIFLDNAYIEQYDALRETIQKKQGDWDACVFYDRQNILERFTTVIGQTQMDEGVADPTSLRYTRVVNRFSPLRKGEDLVFRANVLCGEEHWEMLSELVRGTRHIGLKRNRGMGNVYCELLPDTEMKGASKGKVQGKSEPEDAPEEKMKGREEKSEDWVLESKCADGRVKLTYSIKNEEPLMLSARCENASEGFIPGKMMLGWMAARYLTENSAYQDERKMEYTAKFQDLFLNGKTIYTNLYPGKGGMIHYPAPNYVNILKKTERMVNTIKTTAHEEESDAEFSTKEGNLPKTLQGKFVALNGNAVSVHETKKDIVYHHSHTKKNESGKEGILYGMEVLRKGQVFTGEILLPEEYAETVKKMLLDGEFRFGKSKSSQYGLCRLIRTEKEKLVSADEKEIEAGHDIVVTFLSDAILADEEGNPQVYYDEVWEGVRKALGLEEKAVQTEECTSFLQTTLATGYMGTWNMRRDAVPAICAGSCLVYRINEKIVSGSAFIGMRNAEGFGQVRIDDASAMRYQLSELSVGEGETGEDIPMTQEMRELFGSICLRKWLDGKMLEALRQTEGRLNISNTANGRILLMLTESAKEGEDCNQENENRTNYPRSFKSFEKRIQSIKSDEARNQGEELLEKIRKDILDFKMAEAGSETSLREMQKMGLADEEINAMVRSCWIEYAKTILVNRKYEGRNE